MKYARPPLHFMGSKVAMLKRVKVLLENMQYAGQITKKTIFYDVFGGSGLLSHNIKQWYPHNRVIWNDFDNFKKRLDNIEKTEDIRGRIYDIVNYKGIKAPENKIPQEIKSQIVEVLENAEYLDLVTLSSFFLFSGNYAKTKEKLLAATFYNRIPKNPLYAKGYLEGVERVSMDFKKLLSGIPQEQKESGKALIILDPPYLQTQKGNYKDCYSLKEFCCLVENIFKPYILFSSEKSDILQFLEFLKNIIPSFQTLALINKI